MKIIPAIDILNGQCVRLSMGDYNRQKVYHSNPLEVAREMEDHGIRYLHLVDLDGARSGQIVNRRILEEIASQTTLEVDFGGGIKRDEDIRMAFDSGAVKVTAGSIAVKQPEVFLKWLSEYGADKLILGADCIHRKIAVQGWTERSETDVIDFIREYEKEGVRDVICTDISRDGMLQGPSTELYREILEACNIQLTASGGISSISDLVALKELGCHAAIVGKALYEGKIKLSEITKLC
jgi:phosphoribosylformimino-5-aminoimidazole carboxamide ribotide isomerase